MELKEEYEEVLANLKVQVDSVLTLAAKVEERIQLLSAKEKQWNDTQQWVRRAIEKTSEKILLNVGGKIFTTTKSTLMSVEGSYFHTLLSSGHWLPDKEGEYFVDRDPSLFPVLLEYLRTGDLNDKPLSEYEKAKLHVEADYFQIPLPVTPQQPKAGELTGWWPQACGSQIAILGDTIKKLSSGWNSAILARKPTPTSSKLKIIHRGSLGVMIGLITKSDFDPNSENFTKGWFCNITDGNLWARNSTARMPYMKPVANGSVVEVLCDPVKHTVIYVVNGKNYGVAHTFPLDNKEWYLAVEMFEKDVQLSLLA